MTIEPTAGFLRGSLEAGAWSQLSFLAQRRLWPCWMDAESQALPFQLIVTDMHMPKMDGFGLVEKLKESGGPATATIMMLTSAGHRGDTARCQGVRHRRLSAQTGAEGGIARGDRQAARSQRRDPRPTMITRDSLQEERDPDSVWIFCWRKTISSIRSWPCAS